MHQAGRDITGVNTLARNSWPLTEHYLFSALIRAIASLCYNSENMSITFIKITSGKARNAFTYASHPNYCFYYYLVPVW